MTRCEKCYPSTSREEVLSSTLSIAPVQELRRIAEAVGHLRDRVVLDVVMRSDCRQLRIALEGGETLLLSVLLDDAGKPRLDADLLRAMDDTSHGQLEVGFDGGE